METVIQRYLLKIDEINRLTSTLQASKVLAQMSTADRRRWFNDLLIDAYIEGFSSAAYLLGDDLTPDMNKAKSAVVFRYKPSEDYIQRKFIDYCEQSDYSHIKTLVESEWHRVYNTAQYDAAMSSQYDAEKMWLTMLDDKVRDSHIYLEGITVPMDAYFYTFDGDKALYPGGFESASNNANCRCIVQYRRA